MQIYKSASDGLLAVTRTLQEAGLRLLEGQSNVQEKTPQKTTFRRWDPGGARGSIGVFSRRLNENEPVRDVRVRCRHAPEGRTDGFTRSPFTSFQLRGWPRPEQIQISNVTIFFFKAFVCEF